MLDYKNRLSQELQSKFYADDNCSTNEAFKAFNSVFLEVTDEIAPFVKSVASYKTELPEWFDNSRKYLKSKRNRAHRYWTQDKSNLQKLEKFKGARRKYDACVKKAKRCFYYKRFIECIGDTRRTFKLLDDLKGKYSSRSTVPKLACCVTTNNPTPSDSEVAEAFNCYFANIGKNLQESSLNVPMILPFSKDSSLYLYPTTEIEVNIIFDHLGTKHSSGIDNNSNVLVKVSSSVTIPYLTKIINMFFSEGLFPYELCKAKVFPLHKSGTKLEERNYRPISLIIVWSKIFERVTHTRRYNYFEKFDMLYRKQMDFAKNTPVEMP